MAPSGRSSLKSSRTVPCAIVGRLAWVSSDIVFLEALRGDCALAKTVPKRIQGVPLGIISYMTFHGITFKVPSEPNLLDHSVRLIAERRKAIWLTWLGVFFGWATNACAGF